MRMISIHFLMILCINGNTGRDRGGGGGGVVQIVVKQFVQCNCGMPQKLLPTPNCWADLFCHTFCKLKIPLWLISGKLETFIFKNCTSEVYRGIKNFFWTDVIQQENLITVKLSTQKNLIPDQALIIMTNVSLFFKTLIFNGFFGRYI